MKTFSKFRSLIFFLFLLFVYNKIETKKCNPPLETTETPTTESSHALIIVDEVAMGQS